jgi:phage terminase large subunit-like protein
MTKTPQNKASEATPSEPILSANLLGFLKSDMVRTWVHRQDNQQIEKLNTWKFWAKPCQRPPHDASGDEALDNAWTTWLFLGGRGSGKTRAGAEWIRALSAKGLRIALIGASLHDVREVMIEGPSGLKAIAEKGERPTYEVSRRRLRWPNGAVAYAYSAEDPESLRGPQFHYAWADEFCAWRYGSETLAMLRMGLRLGERPKMCITTTPKPIAALRTLMAQSGVVTTRATTHDNAEHLSESFLEDLTRLYGGTRFAAQELEGLVVDDDKRALWRASDLASCYGARPPEFDALVVAVDPCVSETGDACGIIVAGRVDERAYILEDATIKGVSPWAWGQVVAEKVAQYAASRVVVEANQGGEMVRTILAQAGCEVSIELVHARYAKRARAEPVSALYEQGRVIHAPLKGRFLALEEELMALGASSGSEYGPESGPESGQRRKSPDRADALVWAVTHLLITGRGAPRLRYL